MSKFLHARWMIRRDMNEVLDIERRHAVGVPWGEEDFLKVLRDRNSIGMVVEEGQTVVAFVLYNLEKNRLEIVRFQGDLPEAVSLLCERLVGKLSAERRKRLVMTVNEEDVPLLLQLRDNGMKAVRLVRGAFGNRDGVRMVYRLTRSESNATESTATVL